jgi:exosortase/archaeosortase family protein
MSSTANLPTARPAKIPSDKRSILRFTRAELLTIVVSVGLINAMFQVAVSRVLQAGWLESFLNTFGISALVWAGVYICLKFFSNVSDKPMTSRTRVVLCLVLLFSFLPSSQLIWPALSFLAAYLIVDANDENEDQKRGAWVLLALTVPMFWSKRLFSLFSDIFLSMDAVLVSSITGTPRTANLVAMPGGGGYLQIAAPCSSMANVSLAILAWVLFSRTEGLETRVSSFAWCLAACLSVVVINVTRISLIGYFPQHYELIHGAVGSTFAAWISLVVILFVCVVGVRHVKKMGS